MKNKHIASLSREQREKIRLKAGKLFKKGIHQAEIARKLGVTPAAVNYWHKGTVAECLFGLNFQISVNFYLKFPRNCENLCSKEYSATVP